MSDVSSDSSSSGGRWPLDCPICILDLDHDRDLTKEHITAVVNNMHNRLLAGQINTFQMAIVRVAADWINCELATGVSKPFWDEHHPGKRPASKPRPSTASSSTALAVYDADVPKFDYWGKPQKKVRTRSTLERPPPGGVWGTHYQPPPPPPYVEEQTPPEKTIWTVYCGEKQGWKVYPFCDQVALNDAEARNWTWVKLPNTTAGIFWVNLKTFKQTNEHGPAVRRVQKLTIEDASELPSL